MIFSSIYKPLAAAFSGVSSFRLFAATLAAGMSICSGAQAASFDFDLSSKGERDRPRILPEIPKGQGGAELDNAVRHLSDGAFEKAVRLAETVTQTLPKQAQAWHILGIALANLGKTAAAIDALDMANTLYAKNAEPLLIKGDLLLAQEEIDAAGEAYEAALQKDTSNWRAGESLALLLEGEGDISDAIVRYTQVLRHAPADRAYPRLRLAGLFVQQGKFAEAEGLLETFLRNTPKDADALRVLSRIELAAKKPDEAVETLNRAVTVAPLDPSLRLLLSEAEGAAGGIKAATDVLRQGHIDFPDHAEIAYALGILLGTQRDDAAALAVFERGLDATPDDRQLLKGQGLALSRLGRLDEALATANVLAGRADSGAADLIWRASVEEMHGNPSAAIGSYEAALDIEPQNWLAANNLAVLLTQPNVSRAVSLAEMADRLAPPQVSAVRDTLASVYRAAGRGAEAAAIYEELSKADADNPGWPLKLGETLIGLGRNIEAKQVLDRALTLTPGEAQSIKIRSLLEAL